MLARTSAALVTRKYHGSVMKFSRSLLWLMALPLLLILVSGCHQDKAPRPERQFPVKGKIVSTMPDKGEVMLDHEAIPGFMEAMTMPYRLADPSVLSELHPGDRITATLISGYDAAGPVNMRLTNIVVTAQAKPDYLPKTQYHVPTAGETVPGYPLLNQSGKTIDISTFKGKVVLLTFIYTRCGMSEFCPKMSRNFAEVDKALAADPALYAKTHLLSISFDPAYDTPKVLKSYGGAYTGRYTNETFGHWDFAAPKIKDLPGVEHWFSLGVTGEGLQIQHSLATVIVGKDGKVIAFYPTNDWKIDDVVNAMRQAASS